jgi:hypothetical protein
MTDDHDVGVAALGGVCQSTRAIGAAVADLITPTIDDAENHAASTLTPTLSW